MGTFVLPTVFFLILFFWPFLDRNPDRNPRRRPVAMALLTGGTAGLIGMTLYAIATDVRMHEPALAVEKAPAPKEPAGQIQQLDVAKLYSGNCAACHGVDGSGKQIRSGMPTIPDFTSLAWQMSQTDLEITHRILDGNEPLMPAFRDKLSRDQNLALAIYVRAFAITVPTPTAAKPAPPPPGAVSAQMAPAQVYRAYCLACHDPDGKGNIVRKLMADIPDFTDSKWQASRPKADLAQSILEGKGKFMLPMKDKLGGTDVDQMVAYVRAFQGGRQSVGVEPKRLLIPRALEQPPVASPSPSTPNEPRTISPSAENAVRIRAASVLFREYCLSCHGPDGRGAEIRSRMPDIPDFTSRPWQEAHTNPQLAVSILDGKGSLMPAFRGRVSDDRAGDLVAYVRAFGPVPMPVSQPPANEFEERFRQLEDQWNQLQKELKESAPPKE